MVDAGSIFGFIFVGVPLLLFWIWIVKKLIKAIFKK